MRIAGFRRVLFVLVACATTSSVFGQDALVEVTVTGESVTEDGARYDALRETAVAEGKSKEFVDWMNS